MAKYSYIHWSYGILHKQVYEMIAILLYGGLVADHTHEALKRLASKTKKFRPILR